MKSLKNALGLCLILGALFAALAILPACSTDSSGSSTALTNINSAIDKLSTAMANAWTNGGSSAAAQAAQLYLQQAQSDGSVDSSEASLIQAGIPVLVSLLDSLADQHLSSSATTDTSSKAIVDRATLLQDAKAKLKAKIQDLLAKS